MQEITVEIDKQGRVKIEGEGFTGQECREVTAGIESALGIVASMEPKPELFEETTTTNTETSQR